MQRFRLGQYLADDFKVIGISKRGKIRTNCITYMLIEKAKLQNVRALFASTGVKGDALGEDYYVKELFLPNAINTAPLATILAFTSSPKNNTPVEIDSSKIEAFFATIKANGIDMDSVCDELMSEGLVAFKDAFKEIWDGLKP